MPVLRDHDAVLPTRCDVAVIGAGLVGSALAQALSGLDCSVVLLEAKGDVGDATSKANTALLHTGFDATPGTLESRLVRRGFELLSAYAGDTGIPVERVGAVLVAWSDEEFASLPTLRDKAIANGYHDCALIDADEVYRRLPALGPGALGGLTVPDESLICTWTTSLALATDAVQRGALLALNTMVTGAEVGESETVLTTSRGTLAATWVVNAAGLGSDVIDHLFGYDRFTITPRRGELLVYDKLARPHVPHIILPVPSSVGKGVLISPTIYGNVMLGPTAEDLRDRTDSATSESGIEFLLTKGAKIMPSLLEEEVTASYAGLRAASEHKDYVVDVDAAQRYAVAGGIRSTGLTASMSIAEYLVAAMRDAGFVATEKATLPPPPRMPNLGEESLRPFADEAAIAADPAYGEIVCFCERVTAGEIRDALSSVIAATSLSGLRRRTRVTNGRCQGFYCGADVLARLEAAVEEHS